MKQLEKCFPNLIIFISLLTLTLARTVIIDEDIKASKEVGKKKSSSNYFAQRKNVIDKEDGMSLSGRVQLTPREGIVNNIFMQYKKAELQIGFQNPDKNPAGMHFFKVKEFVENSKVFKFIRRMPKGSVLHLHNSAAVSTEWFIKNITYIPGLLKCINSDNVTILTFREKPEKHNCKKYVNVQKERQKYKSSVKYDRMLESILSVYTPNPELEYASINTVWTKFQNIFTTVKDVVRYLPTFRLYHRRLLEELYEDNVMYAELRINLRGLFDLKREYSGFDYLEELSNIVKEFKKSHPDFMGIKVIYTHNRNLELEELKRILGSFKLYRQKYPNLLIGFDMGGQEDIGAALKDLVEVLADPELQTRYFFHAGETNWYGTFSDLNLVDTLLLNATRIGHGYALLKHPIVRKRLKNSKTAIEICPISNQVLKLVSDLRNHPASFYMAEDDPIVISSDDPSFWSARGVSYDYYFAIMSMSSYGAGLETLKGLVLNSIEYSVLNDYERETARKIFEKQWNEFINLIISNPRWFNSIK